MAHPYNDKREDKVAKSRVSAITNGAASGGSPKCYAAGGAVSSNAGDGVPSMRADGGSVKGRSDRPSRAKGGRVKKAGKGHTVNVIVAPSGGPQAGMGPPKMPMPPPPAAPPPMPPMAVKPPMPPMPLPGAGAPPPGLGGGLPPPPMMRASGGKVNRADGGGVKDKLADAKADFDSAMESKSRDPRLKGDGPTRAKGGKVSAADVKGKTGIGDRTKIQHSGNKSDGQNIGRKDVITKATGGPINASAKMGPKLSGGARGGAARREKAEKAISGAY